MQTASNNSSRSISKHKLGDNNAQRSHHHGTGQTLLHSLTERKARLVEREYKAFQDAVHDDDDANLYSATKQQAGKVRSNKNPRADTEQPMILRNGCITIDHDEDEDTVLSSWWFKLPVYNPEKEKGDSIWVPEKDTNLLTDEYIRDDVLAVDMGAKWIAVSTLYVPLRPRYTVPRRGNPSSP